MKPNRIVIAADYEGMSREAAALIDAAVRTAPALVLALPTGETPIGTYRALVALHRETGTDWSRVTTFNLDEYCDTGPDDPQSYAAYMGQHLFGGVNLGPARTHLPDGTARDAAAEALRYEQAIDAAGGLDLAVLGVGVNGHIGFNEPAAALTAESHVAELADETWRRNFPGLAGDAPAAALTAECHVAHLADETWRRNFPRLAGDPEAVASGRYRRAFTMGIGTILRARSILLLGTGAAKREVLLRAFTGPVTTHTPASLLRLHGDVTLVLDEAAAAPSLRR
jgi:glucosamine-6-phosphate deaminase